MYFFKSFIHFCLFIEDHCMIRELNLHYGIKQQQ